MPVSSELLTTSVIKKQETQKTNDQTQMEQALSPRQIQEQASILDAEYFCAKMRHVRSYFIDHLLLLNVLSLSGRFLR